MLEDFCAGLAPYAGIITKYTARKRTGRDAEWDDPDELMEEEYDDDLDDVEEEDEFGDDVEEFEDHDPSFDELAEEEELEDETDEWDR